METQLPHHDLRFAAIRLLHSVEEFGDCVEDGEPYPCKTIRILDWMPAGAEE